MKICVNCIHCGMPESSSPECNSPNNKTRVTCVVTGKVFESPNYWSCKVHRDANWFGAIAYGMCGKGERWFEERCD